MKIANILKRTLSFVLCLAICFGMTVFVTEDVKADSPYVAVGDPSHGQYKIIAGSLIYYIKFLLSFLTKVAIFVQLNEEKR